MDDKVFTPGDLVSLKSGGPLMVIGMPVPHDGAEGTHVFQCHWVLDDIPQTVEIPAPALMHAEEPTNFTTLAQNAYQAYGEEAGWKNFQGDPMPTWEDLPDNIQDYWRAATLRVVSYCNSQKRTSR